VASNFGMKSEAPLQHRFMSTGTFYLPQQLGPAAPDEYGTELSALADAAHDLDLVLDRTGTIFAMPDEIDTVQRIWLRVLRIILDGGIARYHAMPCRDTPTPGPHSPTTRTANCTARWSTTLPDHRAVRPPATPWRSVALLPPLDHH
jgi:hypothetical protein